MSDNQPISTMSTYTARTWTTGETIDAVDLNDTTAGEFFSIDAIIDEIINAITDIQNHRAGTAAPTDNAIAGQLWYETDTNRLHLDPDGSGADEPLVRSKTVNITAVSKSATGTLMTYTIPANTFKADGKTLRFTCLGRRTGANATADIQVRLATTVAGAATTIAATDGLAWAIVVTVTRTGSATQDIHFTVNENGAAADVQFDTDTQDDTGTISFNLNVSDINASDAVIQEALIIEELN